MGKKIHSGFSGPLFIVGMPRSGTKLLRDLINRHSLIGIPENESQFIPYLYVKFKKFGDLRYMDNFEKLYRTLSVTSFFTRLDEKGLLISKNVWHAAVREWTFSGVIEAFYREYAHSQAKVIWGDKTPSYLIHLA